MFEIKYRIVEDIHYLKKVSPDEFDMEKADVDGFICLNFDENTIGFYHNHLLAEGEFGCELLVTWFDGLLNVIQALDKSDYVALPLIGRYGKYLEFKKVNQSIKVSMVKYDRKIGDERYLITAFKKEFTYPEWKDAIVAQNEFVNEVLDKTRELLTSLITINPNLSHSKTLIGITNKIHEIKYNMKK